MEILPHHKKTIILASIIHTLFQCYTDDEKTKLHKNLEVKISKGFKKMIKIYNRKSVMDLIGLDGIANRIWKELITEFDNGHISIEASSLILYIHNKDAHNLQKFFILSSKNIGEWAKPIRREENESRELDNNSVKVANLLVKKVNKYCNINDNEDIEMYSTRDNIRRRKRGYELGYNYAFSFKFLEKVQKEHLAGVDKDKIMVAFGLNKAQYDFIIL